MKYVRINNKRAAFVHRSEISLIHIGHKSKSSAGEKINILRRLMNDNGLTVISNLLSVLFLSSVICLSRFHF